ncbi:glutamate-5-semialdehyde dehydrogenase [Planctomycetota bacterium]
MQLAKSAHAAKEAAIRLAAIPTEVKNQALAAIAQILKEKSTDIIAANQQDLAQAEQDNLAAPLLKRLKFDQTKIAEVCHGINSLIGLEDPVGQTLKATELDQDLELYRVSSPIGVIGVIFESRPDALVQISTLCLKSGNAVLLKGGSEAAHTNRILAHIINRASVEAGIPAGWIQMLETRADVVAMLKLDNALDLIVPRGSNEFVRYIMDNTSIPVLGHADGICHVYIHAEADPQMAIDIAVDSKCQYVAVCNAAETLLVDEATAGDVLPALKQALDKHNVNLRGCEKTRTVIDVDPASEDDWATEYLDYTYSIKIVSGLDEAVAHINRYGSGHTDAIVTRNAQIAKTFMDLVDAGNVFWNCSTRFSDGFRYGLGAEVGVSTNKIHARGPVGLDGLLIYKWKLIGNGQIVANYSGDQAKTYTHTPLTKQCPL